MKNSAQYLIIKQFHNEVKRVVDELTRSPNVVYLGAKPPEQMPAYLKGLDVGLIPFVVNPSTNTMYPLKLHEYLAMGLPVVSTSLDEVKFFSDVVSIAHDPSKFIFLIEQALAANSAIKVEQRVATARENSWEQRVKHMSEAIEHKIGKISEHGSGDENLLRRQH